MPIVEIKCYVEGCSQPPKYSRLVRAHMQKRVLVTTFEDSCAQHAESFMRCRTNQTDARGDCGWCWAVNGEACKLLRNRA